MLEVAGKGKLVYSEFEAKAFRTYVSEVVDFGTWAREVTPALSVATIRAGFTTAASTWGSGQGTWGALSGTVATYTAAGGDTPAGGYSATATTGALIVAAAGTLAAAAF